MSEHTPGKWVVSRFDHLIVIADDVDRKRIAECRSKLLDETEAAANARLIAAAPDMLKALKAIHYYETIRDPNRGELYLGALRQVEDAIAKAENKP